MRRDTSPGTLSRMPLNRLSRQLGSVTRAGRLLGFGWSNSQQARGKGDDATVMAHVLPTSVEAAIVDVSLHDPTWGAIRIANELLRRGVSVSRTDVLHVWRLHDLSTTADRHRAATRAGAAIRAMTPTGTKRRSVMPVFEAIVLLAVIGGLVVAFLQAPAKVRVEQSPNARASSKRP